MIMGLAPKVLLKENYINECECSLNQGIHVIVKSQRDMGNILLTVLRGHHNNICFMLRGRLLVRGMESAHSLHFFKLVAN